MTPARSFLPLFAILIGTVGCHRSLQIGEPMPFDGSVADAPPSPPWYVRDQAFVGPELRLPPAARADLGVSVAASTPPLTVSAPPDGHLLVVRGGRLYSLAAGAERSVVETPLGVAVVGDARQFAWVLPQRRTLLMKGVPNTFALEVAASPALSTSPLQVQVRGEAPNSLRTLTEFASGMNVNATATHGEQTLIEFSQGTRHALVAFATGHQRSDVATYPDSEARSTALLRYADSWLRVRAFRDTNSRFQLTVQSLDQTWPDAAVSPWGVPWLDDVLPSPVRDVFSVVAAVHDNTLVVAYSDYEGTRFRFASLAERRWLGEWTRISSGPTHNAMAWDTVTSRFVLAAGTYVPSQDNNTWTSVETRFLALTPTGASEISRAALFRSQLVEWQQQLWAVGQDLPGRLHVFRATEPYRSDNATIVDVPHSQALGELVVTGDAVLSTWTDEVGQVAVTRIAFDVPLRADSRTVLPGLLEPGTGIPTGMITHDADNVYVSRASNALPVARIDPRTLDVLARTQLGMPLACDLTRAPGCTLVTPDYVVGAANNSLYVHNRRGAVSKYDRDFHLVQETPFQFTSIGPCQGTSCAVGCFTSTCGGPNRSSAGVLELDESAEVRPWSNADATRFPTCDTAGLVARRGQECREGDGYFVPGTATLYRCGIEFGAEGEGCEAASAIAHSQTHTVLIEPRRGPLGLTRVAVRLFAHGSNAPIATQWFRPDELYENRRDSTGNTLPIHLVHARGGLFILVYNRRNSLNGLQEAYARAVYFPEAETVAP